MIKGDTTNFQNKAFFRESFDDYVEYINRITMLQIFLAIAFGRKNEKSMYKNE